MTFVPSYGSQLIACLADSYKSPVASGLGAVVGIQRAGARIFRPRSTSSPPPPPQHPFYPKGGTRTCPYCQIQLKSATRRVAAAGGSATGDFRRCPAVPSSAVMTHRKGLRWSCPDWHIRSVPPLRPGHLQFKFDNYGGAWGEAQDSIAFFQSYAGEKPRLKRSPHGHWGG